MNKDIKKGSSGAEVKKLQRMLNEVLSLNPKLQLDGAFGIKTEKALKIFQKSKTLKVDGIAGKATWLAINSEYKKIIIAKARQTINLKHKVVDRMKWGVKHPKTAKLTPDWNYKGIVLHHSGNAGEKNPTKIETKHMVTNNWDDVGYHYLIHPNGTVYEGRKIYHKGSHVNGANTGKIGVLLMGDYNEQWWDFDDTLSKSHISSANRLITTLKNTFPNIRYLGGHKEYLPGKGYSCPGNLIMDKLNKMRKKHGLIKP